VCVGCLFLRTPSRAPYRSRVTDGFGTRFLPKIGVRPQRPHPDVSHSSRSSGLQEAAVTTAVTVTEWKKIRDAGLPRPRDVSDVEEPSSRRPQARALGSSVFAAGGVRARRVREGRGEVCASVCVKRKLQPVLDLNSNHGLTNETLISGRPEIISGMS